jgi:hypothetical protein
MSQQRRPEIDDSLLQQVAALPPSGQRWLKTALQTIVTIDPSEEQAEREEGEAPAPPAEKPARSRPGLTLDDVLSGKADLSEQAEAYPELAEELQDIANIANLLQEAGRERRRLGEQILREEILGEPAADEAEAEQDDDEGA